jgi:N-acetylglutamate synthase-like GNAT family acetyltransferase
LPKKTDLTAPRFTLRAHRSGDIGWVAHRQGLLYAEEYGFDITFEALVAEIAAKFVQRFDPQWERCWIAERGGRIAGSVFVVRKSAQVAQLRLLYAEPWARGSGLGRRLTEECIAFARAAGYRKLVLWTQSNLDAARRIYLTTGFRLVKEEPHRSFGHDLVGEYWALKL